MALVGQRGGPETLPCSQEARGVEHRVRHESPIRLLPAPHIHARHLRDVLDPGRANSQRGTHRRIVDSRASIRIFAKSAPYSLPAGPFATLSGIAGGILAS